MIEYKLIGKNVPSSKNSKRITKSGKIIPSKLTVDYIDWALPQLETYRDFFVDERIKNNEEPVKIGFYLYRQSKHRYDFINAVQVLADLFVRAKYIEDDDTKHFIPVFLGEEYVGNEQNAGVSFKILKTI